MFHHSKFQPMVWLWNPPIQLFDYIVTILSLARYVCFFILYISCALYFNEKHSNLNTLQKLKVYAWRNCKIWNIRKQKDIFYFMQFWVCNIAHAAVANPKWKKDKILVTIHMANCFARQFHQAQTTFFLKTASTVDWR